MSIEAIKSIREAEQEGQQLIKDAQQTAKQLIFAANEKAAKLLDEQGRETDKKVSAILSEAQKSANGKFQEIIENTKQECEIIKKEALKRIDDAVGIILERVSKAE